MKKVYIVVEDEWCEGMFIERLFEKEEDAKKYANELKLKHPVYEDNYYYIEQEVF